MKKLKFSGNLPELILSGNKNVTWRINDEKDLSVGDELYLVRSETLEEFSKAIIINVKNKTFDELVESDWTGHERFSSFEKMYETYSNYYNFEVSYKTKLKIVEFKLI